MAASAPQFSSEDLLERILSSLDEDKAEDVTRIDLRGKTSIEDLLGYIAQQDPSLAKKVYIMQDCTASVVIPGVYDFTDDANKAMQEFAAAGMNLVDSTTPMQDWLGVRL